MDNRRSTIVINKRFQYQYALLIAAGAVLLVNGFLIAQMLFPGNATFSLPTDTALAIGAVELILILAIWYGSLRASHRIAGPVHVFTRELAKLGEGDLTCDIALRDTDMFRLEADSINSSVAALRNRVARLKHLASQANQAKATGADASNVLAELYAELAKFRTGDEDAR